MSTGKSKAIINTRNIAILFCALVTASCAPTDANNASEKKAAADIVINSELDFIPLNPARGDAAPQAGILWGDIRSDVPSGVLLKFADGFSSPPHIHNITYRAVVIEGAVHNDDPTAEKMWMGPGAFWTQPAGENHITAGRPGSVATAFLEIMRGPYLVQPASQAFDTGERPINLQAENVVWLDAADVNWVKTGTSGKSASLAFLWGDTQNGKKNGTFLKLPPQKTVSLQGNAAWLRAVVIKGNINYHGDTDLTPLETGSYFGSQDGGTHVVTCKAAEDCVLYISTEGKYDVQAASPK